MSTIRVGDRVTVESGWGLTERDMIQLGIQPNETVVTVDYINPVSNRALFKEFDGKDAWDKYCGITVTGLTLVTPKEVVEETFAPLETNDAGETNLDVNATLEQRGNRYGSFEQHASISQGLLHLALQHADKAGVVLDHVHKEALGMIFHKIGRIVNGDPNYYDSWKDIAGYATLAEQWVTKGETV